MSNTISKVLDHVHYDQDGAQMKRTYNEETESTVMAIHDLIKTFDRSQVSGQLEGDPHLPSY